MALWKSALGACLVLATGPAIAKRTDADFSQAPMRFVGRLDVKRSGFVGLCTATLVGHDLILTAAHCLRLTAPVTDGRVTSGDAVFRLQLSNGAEVASSKLISMMYDGDYGRHPYPFAGTDWAIARLEKPLGKKFGYVEIANAEMALGTKMIVGGYSIDTNKEHPGLDSQCEVIDPDTKSLMDLKARGAPVKNIFLTDCDIKEGASGGPMVANVAVRLRGGTETVLVPRVVGLNAGIDRGLGKPNALGTLAKNFYFQWGSWALHGPIDELHGFYEGKLPTDLPETLRKLLEVWGRGKRDENVTELRRLLTSEKSIAEMLVEVRARKAEFLAAKEKLYDFGATFDSADAPLRIGKVTAESPAAEAGLKRGDVVVLSAKEAYPNEAEFFACVHAAAGTVPLSFRRGKTDTEVTVTLRAKTTAKN